MVLCIATRGWKDWSQCVESWQTYADLGPLPYSVVFNREVLDAYQQAWNETDEDIMAFIHDDVMIYEGGWDVRVLQQFADPTVGMVCFGGALGHGTPDLYTSPYKLSNLARQHFMSNMRSAALHGARFSGERDVAVADGFALFVRRPILDKGHGWPVDKPVGYYMYSEWLCCETRRQGYRIRLVGVDCEHLGGKTATLVQLTDNYEEAHRYFYDNNHDVMPFEVKE